MSADSHGRAGAQLLEQARALQTSAMSRRRDCSAEALPLYRQALEEFHAAAGLAPQNRYAHRFCGAGLTELGALEAARDSFAHAYRVATSDPEAAAEYASSLQSTGDSAGAARVFESALREHPAHAGLHAAYALTLLGGGDFARGWDEYEWRLKLPQAGIERPFPFPRWQGDALGGRTLLVYTEQGVGDEIMFASCFDELIGAAGHCVLEASQRLVPLFERSFPRARLLTRNLAKVPDWSRLPAIDCCIAAGSVPRFLRYRLEDFPRLEAYLRPDLKKVTQWKERLASSAKPRIGLAWTGGVPATLRSARPLSLEDLPPLARGVYATWGALRFLARTAGMEALNQPHPSSLGCWA